MGGRFQNGIIWDAEIAENKPLKTELVPNISVKAEPVNLDVAESDNGVVITATDVRGTTKAQLRHGKDGAPGKDGYTPMKGVDYFDGAPGAKGDTGATPNIQIGTVTTLPAGSNATVTRRGTDASPVLDFGIPKGADGQGGSSVTVDPTLSQPGQAADAAATGEVLNMLAFPSQYSYNAAYIGLKEGSSNASHNSDVWEAFITQNSNQNNRCVFFPAGGWYFARPVNFGNLACVYGDGEPTYSKTPTRLYANAETDGDAAFTATSTSLVNIGLQGNDSKQHYALSVNRDKLLTDPDGIFVEDWDGKKTIGLLTSGTVQHQNIVLRNFYVGALANTGNITFDSCHITQCHTGMIISNDCYVHNLKAWKIMLAVETKGNLAHITNIRGDSIGLHLISCLVGGLDVNGADADFCMGSVIHFGGEPTLSATIFSKRSIGHIADIRGRAALFSAYNKNELYTMQGKNGDRCSLISFEPGTEWYGGIFETNYAQPSNPMDYTSNLLSPAAEICIPEGAKLVGARLRTMNTSWASADTESIAREHIRIDSPGSAIFVESGYGDWNVYRDENGFSADAAEVGTEIGQLKEDLTQLEQLMPEAAPVAGKVLKVLAVNEDGTFTCEWADGGSDGGISDVKIGDKSIVSSGVATIPYSYNTTPGLVYTGGVNNGLKYENDRGLLVVNAATNGMIDGRASHASKTYPIRTYNLDYAVKAAMCDGKGEAWTAEEQAAAQERIGILSVEEVLF